MTATDAASFRALVEGYADAVDRRDGATLIALFTGDAVLITPKGELRGADQIGSIPDRLGRYKHTNHRVIRHDAVTDDAGTTAHGVTRCSAQHVYDADGTEREYVMDIVYHDRFVRTPSGWRFAERRLELVAEDDRAVSAPG